MAIFDTEHSTLAKDVINQLSIVLRNGHLHNIENDAVLETIIKLRDIINPCLKTEGFLKIELLGEFFYVNDMRIRHPLEYLLNFDYITEEFRRRDIGSVIFLSPVEIKDMKIFLNAFINSAQSNMPYDAMVESLGEIYNIKIDRLKKVKEDEELDRRKIAKKTYFSAVSFAKGVMKSIKGGEKISIKKAKRIVESMVDALLSEEQLLVGMTSIKDYDDYTYHHSINVSILSIAVGQRIGLNRRHITALGIAALFHDIGKTEIPKEVLNKPSKLNEEEWEVMRRHPFWGAMSILKLKGLDEISVQNAIVAFQHHINYDLSGYPKLREPVELSFYSRIITIADRYDAMTASRVYKTMPMSPDRTLGFMMEKSGIELDPVLLKFFVNMVGSYPAGTLVLLDTGEMGLVYEGNHIMPDRPKVMIIVNASGSKGDGFSTDLAEKDPTGGFKRTVTKTLDPKEFKISLAEYLL
jgi:HD-GYP domain-containing protein (c-di-GMP phosphodiesterase class II)